MESRITRLRTEMAARSLDALLVTHLPHVRYLCGFSGSAGLLFVTASDAIFVTDFRYQEQIAQELPPGVTGVIDRAPYERLRNDGHLRKGMKVGFQDGHITVAALSELKRKARGISFEPTGSMIAEATLVKSDQELTLMRRAAQITGRVYREILEIAAPGIRENEIAAEISYRGRRYGAQGDAFEIIVASGPRGALPHGRASSRKIRKGEFVTLDFGFNVDGFNSDMTRTFAVGEPSEEARRIYDIVHRAQRKGVAAARAGMTGKELDDVCRDEIAAAGYGAEFGHSTGHGLGIEVHEMPMISARGEAQTLRENMVVTIEPGIYLPGWLGVRIEDDIVIGTDRSRSLTTSPRELIVV